MFCVQKQNEFVTKGSRIVHTQNFSKNFFFLIPDTNMNLGVWVYQELINNFFSTHVLNE